MYIKNENSLEELRRSDDCESLNSRPWKGRKLDIQMFILLHCKKACWPNQKEDATKGSVNLTVEYFLGVFWGFEMLFMNNYGSVIKSNQSYWKEPFWLQTMWTVLGTCCLKWLCFTFFAQFLVLTMDLTITVTKLNFLSSASFFNRL